MYLFELGNIYFAYSRDSWGEKMWETEQKGATCTEQVFTHSPNQAKVKSLFDLCALLPHKMIQIFDLDTFI